MFDHGHQPGASRGLRPIRMRGEHMHDIPLRAVGHLTVIRSHESIRILARLAAAAKFHGLFDLHAHRRCHVRGERVPSGWIEITVTLGHGDRSRHGFRVMQIADRGRDLLFHVRA